MTYYSICYDISCLLHYIYCWYRGDILTFRLCSYLQIDGDCCLFVVDSVSSDCSMTSFCICKRWHCWLLVFIDCWLPGIVVYWLQCPSQQLLFIGMAMTMCVQQCVILMANVCVFLLAVFFHTANSYSSSFHGPCVFLLAEAAYPPATTLLPATTATACYFLFNPLHSWLTCWPFCLFDC